MSMRAALCPCWDGGAAPGAAAGLVAAAAFVSFRGSRLLQGDVMKGACAKQRHIFFVPITRNSTLLLSVIAPLLCTVFAQRNQIAARNGNEGNAAFDTCRFLHLPAGLGLVRG